ncbi:MAG TPA: hypothetical protein PLT76_08605 [Candidatus Omnitrophota bacterium]|nr:hypothetical protein [Candidatus Omnitrophota bacterium]HPB67838.1 hypothetical protein [Candidatus Omnitrophota bacterium]HQO58762.1 hypothetical protein [Candidatus Omnitrophota bacterium]
MKNKTIIFVGMVILSSLFILGVIFYNHHRLALHKPLRMMGMSRDEYQAYQLEHQQLLFENERLVRQLQALEEAAARQGLWLSKVKEENLHLRDKILLMDRLSRLHQSVAQLREQESRERAVREKETAVEPDGPAGTLSWATLEEARTALEKAKIKIQSVREKMDILISEDEGEQFADQEETERVQALSGNKGYLFMDRPLLAEEAL